MDQRTRCTVSRRSRGGNRCRYDHKCTFRTYKTAEKAAKRLPEPGEPYWCAIAGGWHVRRGDQAEYDRRQALRWNGEAS